MLCIKLNKNTPKEEIITWHVGSSLKLQSTDLMDVDWIQADGHELKYMYENCPKAKFGNNAVEALNGEEAMAAAAMLLAQVSAN